MTGAQQPPSSHARCPWGILGVQEAFRNKYFPRGTFQGRESHPWINAGQNGNWLGKKKIQICKQRTGIIRRVEGREGREAPLLQGTSGSAGTQRDVERGRSSPITCPWPQNLPAPPGPPCPVGRYSLREYLGISAVGNRRGAPEHWPNKGNSSRGDKSPRHPQLGITLFPRKPPWLGVFQPGSSW